MLMYVLTCNTLREIIKVSVIRVSLFISQKQPCSFKARYFRCVCTSLCFLIFISVYFVDYVAIKGLI